jgi:hypothetical protein
MTSPQLKECAARPAGLYLRAGALLGLGMVVAICS